jgi:hypothetical protein
LNTLFRETFEKDLAEISNERLLQRIHALIEQVEKARTFQEILISNNWTQKGNITEFASEIIASALCSKTSL